MGVKPKERSNNDIELQKLLFSFLFCLLETNQTGCGFILVKYHVVCDPLLPVSRIV